MQSTKLRRSSFAIIAILVVAVAVGWFSTSAFADVSPPEVEITLEPGESFTLTKTVTTPEIPQNPDIAFLADTTGSMGPEIADVQANAGTVLTAISTAQPTAQFSVSEYRDIFDAFRFQVNAPLTSSISATQAAINGWSAGGGGDIPEAQLPALKDLADGLAGWRTGSTRIVVWFGDEPGHDPRAGVSLAAAISALQAAGVQVIAVDVRNLDSTGQATAITSATSGSLESDASGVSAAILTGLGNLPVTVTPVVTCGSGVSVSLSPASITAVSGDTVTFQETVTALGSAVPGTEIHCEVEFQTAGGSIGEQTVWVTIPPLGVDIDIKPGSNPSSFGCDSKGSIPVAVLGSATFDATSIDADTVRFGVVGNETGEVHVKKGFAKRHVEDSNEDGFLDMIFHFDFSETGFDCDDILPGDSSVTLDGTLTGELEDGSAFTGTSDIRLTAGKGK